MGGWFKTKEDRYYEYALAILADRCPPDKRMYLCSYIDSYNDDLCKRCWENVLKAEKEGLHSGRLYTDKAQRMEEGKAVR